MNDDFFRDEPEEKGRFKRGANKTVAPLKPWQGRDDKGAITVAAKRCNLDGAWGCDQYRPISSFHRHPLLCDRCSEGLMLRYQAARVDVLVLLLQEERGLYTAAKAMGASGATLKALRAGEEERITERAGDLHRQWNKIGDVLAAGAAYRRAWFESAEIGAPVPGPLAGALA